MSFAGERKNQLDEINYGFLIYLLHRSIVHHLNTCFIEVGFFVTIDQWPVLYALYQRDGITQQELVEATCKDKTALTRMIDTLCQRGLVRRTRDLSDGRRNKIMLTDKGKRIQQDLKNVFRKHEGKMLRDIAKSDLTVCRDTIMQMMSNLLSREAVSSVEKQLKEKVDFYKKSVNESL